jgi:uncharacterized protein (UPF0276 family)
MAAKATPGVAAGASGSLSLPPGGEARLRGAGIGLRACHQREIVDDLPAVAWLEAHTENYFAPGGPQRAQLMRLGEHYPLSLHGVGLSLGSTDPLSPGHLAAVKQLERATAPALISEHLSWGCIGERHFNDLLPLPYTDEALRHMCTRVQQVQAELGRQILIENVSSYLQYSHSRLTEWDFLATLAAEAQCGVLLDLNNIYVSAVNHGFDPYVYINAIPVAVVQEFHLAGHTVNQIGQRDVLIDTHGTHVSAAVWQLYAHALRRFGAVPTLIEWDTDIPALEVLMNEAAVANQIMESRRADAC